MLNAKDGDVFISDWLRNRNTIEFLGIWESVHKPSFNYGEFATIAAVRRRDRCPYVWNEVDQWEPLWRDLERVAQRMLDEPTAQHQPHFLGTVQSEGTQLYYSSPATHSSTRP